MQAHPSFAVVVVTWNHASTLGACLDAVQRLEPAPAEVVVVDNASTDSSVSVAHRAAVQVIEETANTGFAAAANRGLKATSAPWILLVNPDCALESDFVTAIAAVLAGRPETAEVGSATGLLLRAHGDDLEATDAVDAAGMIVTPAGRHLDRGAGSTDCQNLQQPAWVFGGTGAATLYRREALEDVAYPSGEVFAESFFAYREDAELAWRLQLRGWRCLYSPSARGLHRRGFQPEGGRHGHAAINRLSVRNRFLLRLHCADGSWHLRSLPWWLLRDLLVVGACLTVETSSLPALADVWRGRSHALACRRWVLGRRTVPAGRMQRWFRRPGWTEELN